MYLYIYIYTYLGLERDLHRRGGLRRGPPLRPGRRVPGISRLMYRVISQDYITNMYVYIYIYIERERERERFLYID